MAGCAGMAMDGSGASAGRARTLSVILAYSLMITEGIASSLGAFVVFLLYYNGRIAFQDLSITKQNRRPIWSAVACLPILGCCVLCCVTALA